MKQLSGGGKRGALGRLRAGAEPEEGPMSDSIRRPDDRRADLDPTHRGPDPDGATDADLDRPRRPRSPVAQPVDAGRGMGRQPSRS